MPSTSAMAWPAAVKSQPNPAVTASITHRTRPAPGAEPDTHPSSSATVPDV